MLEYSKRAIQGLAFLFLPYNDIDVYVEDTTCRRVYDVVINRMLNGNAVVTRVFQLGGRTSVIEECEKRQGNFSRPCLFIIDGDFDHALGVSAPALERLYRLNVYCLENILFCRAAITRVACDSLSNSSRQEVEKKLSFSDFEAVLQTCLFELFVVYSIARALDQTIKTSGRKVHTMLTHHGRKAYLDESKVRSKGQEIRDRLAASHTVDSINQLDRDIRERIRRSGITFKHLVSGKTYLLSLVLIHLKRSARYRGSQDDLMVNLAHGCDLGFEKGLCDAVNEAARNS